MIDRGIGSRGGALELVGSGIKERARSVFAAVLIALALSFSGCDFFQVPEPPPPLRLTPVPAPSPTVAATPAVKTEPVGLLKPGPQTRPVVLGTFVKTVSSVGSLVPGRQLPVYTRRAGVITEVSVKVWDQVEQGQTIARVEVADPELAQRAVDRELAQARLNLADLELKLTQARNNPPRVDEQIDVAQLELDKAALDFNKAQRRNYDREVRTAERHYRWAKDDADIRSWWYEQTGNLDELTRLQAGAEVAEAADRLDVAQQTYEALRDGKDLWLDELALKQQTLKKAEKRLEEVQKQASVLLEIHTLQVSLLEKQVTEAKATTERAEKAAAEAGQPIELVSPITGLVTAVNVGPGEVAQPYAPLLAVAEPTVSKALVSVAERDIASLAVGQEATVTISALNEVLLGQVTWVSFNPVKDKETTYQVEISLRQPDSRAKVGMTANARIVLFQKEDVLLIPTPAIRTRDDKHYVEVLEGESSREVEIELGLQGDTEVQVTAGLQEGQLVSVGPRPPVGGGITRSQ